MTAYFNTHTRRLFQTLCLIACLFGSAAHSEDSSEALVFLQFADPAFRDGLAGHGMLGDAGFRLHNTGFTPTPFGAKWENAPLLEKAKASGRPYYIDRITGGMPFQSLEGINTLAYQLKDDPNFLGFQAHEWGNSPTHDYHRIHDLILGKGLPLDAESFATIEGRTESPYFSGGDYAIYNDLFTDLSTQADVETYLTKYFSKLVDLTAGQLVSVTGYGQLHHTALRLGARNIMAEIGNQVPLTAFQIASARGAGRQHGKPFGVYYEPWGGAPMGCICATSFSPWFPNEPRIKEKMDGYNIGPQHGSSRSLQRRLLYFAWLSGAAWWSEEWGAENYFTNWEDFPLTEYGEIVKEFQEVTRQRERPRPIVPVAIVMPENTFGVDIRYVAGFSDTLWRIAPGGDAFHDSLRKFAKAFFATQRAGGGRDAHNLTPSSTIGSFDIFDATVADTLLEHYACVVYFDPAQNVASKNAVLFDGTPETIGRIESAIQKALPYDVQGTVGAIQARANERCLVGLFNNLGVAKSPDGESADPTMTQTASVHGPTEGLDLLVGQEFITTREIDRVELTIPPGKLVVLSYPDSTRIEMP